MLKRAKIAAVCYQNTIQISSTVSLYLLFFYSLCVKILNRDGGDKFKYVLSCSCLDLFSVNFQLCLIHTFWPTPLPFPVSYLDCLNHGHCDDPLACPRLCRSYCPLSPSALDYSSSQLLFLAYLLPTSQQALQNGFLCGCPIPHPAIRASPSS